MNSVTRPFCQLEKDCKRREFRWRQLTLAGLGGLHLAAFCYEGYGLFAATGILFFTCAAQEALRFRKAGTTLQTRRTIWRGSTPWDAQHRYLLDGWTPFGRSR